MTGAVRAVAAMTFREAVRDRVLYLLLAFALVIIAASRLLALRLNSERPARCLLDLLCHATRDPALLSPRAARTPCAFDPSVTRDSRLFAIQVPIGENGGVWSSTPIRARQR